MTSVTAQTPAYTLLTRLSSAFPHFHFPSLRNLHLYSVDSRSSDLTDGLRLLPELMPRLTHFENTLVTIPACGSCRCIARTPTRSPQHHPRHSRRHPSFDVSAESTSVFETAHPRCRGRRGVATELKTSRVATLSMRSVHRSALGRETSSSSRRLETNRCSALTHSGYL